VPGDGSKRPAATTDRHRRHTNPHPLFTVTAIAYIPQP
jgi:hypothetical protein